MKSKNLSIVIIGTLFLLLPALAQECHQQERPCAPQPFPWEQIQLTPEQREKIETIRTETRKIVIPLRSQIELEEIELEKEMKKEKPDRNKIMEHAKKIHDWKWQIEQANIEERLKIHSVLTPEQIEKLKTERFLHRNVIMPPRHIWTRDD